MRAHAFPRRSTRRPPAVQSGFSLIELMLALLLGLIVVAAAGGVFLANKRVYAASETLNRVQENSRVSFELMARDVREAGGSPCGTSSEVVNMLKNGGSGWWTSFGDGLRGYNGGAAAGTGSAPVPGAVAGTDAIDLYMANGSGDVAIKEQNTPSAVIDVSSVNGIADGDIVIACNTQYTLVFQVTGVNGSSLKLQHGGGAGAPGNCGQEFQWKTPTNCSGASNPFGYCFTPKTSAQCTKDSSTPAVVAKVGSVRWYVAANGRGGRSLYRAQVVDKSTTNTVTISNVEEIAEGIADMQIRYRTVAGTAFVDAAGIADWKQVNAVEVRVVAEAAPGALTNKYLLGTDNKPISREYTHVVALRNRPGVL